jgi:hypothetical protein
MIVLDNPSCSLFASLEEKIDEKSRRIVELRSSLKTSQLFGCKSQFFVYWLIYDNTKRMVK